MSSSVITQEIHVVKRALSKTVRDLICQKVEEVINAAPQSFTKEEWEQTFKNPSHSLHLFRLPISSHANRNSHTSPSLSARYRY